MMTNDMKVPMRHCTPRILFAAMGLWIGLLNAEVSAQGNTVTQDHAWLMYFGNHRLSERWGLHTEYQWRRNEGLQNWQQSLMRIGVDYYTKAGPLFTAGYGWILSYPYGQQPIAYSFNEHRIWEQMILTSKAGRFNFNHRYRLEQRFLEQKRSNGEGDYVADGTILKQRVRYRFMVSIPINHKEMEDNTVFLALYEEPFLQFGKHVGANIMDQNRLYCALGWRFNKAMNIQVGYLNQYIAKADGINAERNHTLQVGFTYNVDFRHKEEAPQ